MNRKLNVYLYGKLIGILSENNLGHLEFQYSENAYPISVRMPVTCDKYDETFTEPFFDNLTPEGNALDLIINLFRISKGNTFSVLNKIGGDCAGAISLYTNEPQNNIDNPLIEINENSLSKIIEELPNNPLLTSLKKAPRLSLAGVQSKFALHKGIDGKYYRSDENNPTTHIIKIANDRFENLLENELFCMKLSKTIFKDAINVELKTIKNNKFLEIERYDRKYINNKVERIHQEDFCQVLGYLSKNKYQIEKGPKISQIYNAIYKYSNQKLNDGYKFIKLLIFNYLLGNTDAHAKNFSFLHIDNKNGVILSPAYDLVSIDIYPKKIVSHEIAMTINGKGNYDSIKKQDFEALFKQLKLNIPSVNKEMQKAFYDIRENAQNLSKELNANKETSSQIYDEIIKNIEKRYLVLFG